MRPQICGKYVTFYPTKLNPMTFFKGRCLTWALIIFSNGQELHTCPQTPPLLGVRIKQWLKGNKIYFFVKNT